MRRYSASSSSAAPSSPPTRYGVALSVQPPGSSTGTSAYDQAHTNARGSGTVSVRLKRGVAAFSAHSPHAASLREAAGARRHPSRCCPRSPARRAPAHLRVGRSVPVAVTCCRGGGPSSSAPRATPRATATSQTRTCCTRPPSPGSDTWAASFPSVVAIYPYQYCLTDSTCTKAPLGSTGRAT